MRFQDELAASRGQIALKLVAIYKALGGDWQTPPMRGGDPVMDHSALPQPDVESEARPEP